MDTDPHYCVECFQQVHLIFHPYPEFFGHIISEEDYREFIYSGLCSFCTHILADFAAFDTRNGAW